MYTSNGYSVALKTDFRVWLKYSYLQEQGDKISLSPPEMTRVYIDLCCKDVVGGLPFGFVLDALIWFFSCADVERMQELKIKDTVRDHVSKRPRLTSLFWDFRQIWASFKHQYNIDLYTCGTMHWWEFRRLLDGIKNDTPLAALMQLRQPITMDIFMGKEKAMEAARREKWPDHTADQVMSRIPK